MVVKSGARGSAKPAACSRIFAENRCILSRGARKIWRPGRLDCLTAGPTRAATAWRRGPARLAQQMAGNANSGRRPQPTQIRLLRGNPGKRRINPAEPAPAAVDASFDTPPGELTGDQAAIDEWRRVAPMLRACRLVTEAERPALLALCQVWSRYLEATARVRELGILIKKPKGIPMVNPYIAVADKALSHCQRLWMELGLTPSGRAKISALPDHTRTDINTSKWTGLLSGVTDARNL